MFMFKPDYQYPSKYSITENIYFETLYVFDIQPMLYSC